ncbi:MAG: putative oxidoreductase [Propionibacteriaceae bacterium]|nr:putative oxidoreductase [Propionibacteriaceae bacterium]
MDKGGTDDLIDDTLNFLFTNSAREIKLADVAARAAMSESSFSRYFRRSAGQSFSDTVRKLRLAHPGIIITPLAKDELSGPCGEGYRRMIELCPVGRAGTPDEVGTVGALLMGAEGAFITGSDFLMDGGVTAAYRFGELAPE